MNEDGNDDKAASEREKKEGNRLMGEMDYVGAIDCYSRAIAHDRANHFLWSNRAAARLLIQPESAEQLTLALEDAEECVRLCPAFTKGHYRRAVALTRLGRPTEARDALESAISSSKPSEDSARDIAAMLTQTELTIARSAREKSLRSGDGGGVGSVSEIIARLMSVDAFEMNRRDHREAFAAAVALTEEQTDPTDCSSTRISDSDAARVFRAATRTKANAAAFGGFAGAMDAMVGVARRCTEIGTLADTVRALASASAGNRNNKALLSKADIVGTVERLFGMTELIDALFQSPAPTPSSTKTEDVRNCIEAVGDIATVSAEMQATLADLGFVEKFLGLAESREELRDAALSSLASLCSCHDGNRARLLAMGGIGRIVGLFSGGVRPAVDMEVIEALRVVADGNDGAKEITESAAAMDTAMTTLCRESGFAVKSDDGETRSPEQSAVALVTELSEKPATVVTDKPLISLVSGLLANAGAQQTPPSCVRNIAAAVGAISARRDSTAAVWPFIDSVVGWVRQDNDRDLRVAAIWTLGNVCRSEETVVDMVASRGVGRLLLGVVTNECQNYDKVADDSRVVLSAFGALRNLAIPRANKAPLVECGALRVVCDALPIAGCKNQHVAFDGVVLLTSLIRGNPRRARMLADVPGALHTITSIARGQAIGSAANQTDSNNGKPTPVIVVGPNGERDLRVQYEAGRLVAELCTLEDRAQELHSLGALEALATMMASSFEVLRSEAVAAAKSLQKAGIDIEELHIR